MFLWNVGNQLQDCTASQPRRPQLTSLLPSKPQISDLPIHSMSVERGCSLYKARKLLN
jgi:hypothetical protein